MNVTRPQAATAPPDDFLSGASGQVWGIRATSKAMGADALCDTIAAARLERPRLARAAARWPRRRVLVLSVEREGMPNLLAAATRELARSRHEVQIAVTPAGDRGKFENLDRLLENHPVAGQDWLLVVDDDVALPRGFLDTFVFLAERFDLRLAQPAHRWRSHAAFAVTRRRPASIVRQTGFVEIGPVTALHSDTFGELLPFPPLRAGWGLDAHWAAVACARGWPLGIVDATPVLHGLRRTASSYDRHAAVDEARHFLADRPYRPARESQRTLAVHRRW
jgi:hypothetical protein